MKRPFVFASPLLALLACGGSSPTTPTVRISPSPIAPAASVETIRVISPVALDEGGAAQLLVVSVLPNGSFQPLSASSVEWQSSDSSVASVSSIGVVNALRIGGVDIHAAYREVAAEAHVEIHAAGGRINVGDTVRDGLVNHGSSRAFLLTAASNGRIVLQVSWDTRQGLLELKVDGERVPGTSPLVTEFQAAAGRTYQLLISDGSQWDDYGESFNVPFTLVTALK